MGATMKSAKQAKYVRNKCIHQIVEIQTDHSPDRIAVVFENCYLTYSELNIRANCLAHRLRDLGVGPGVIVGICLEKSADMVVSMIAVLKAGGAYLPLDPEYPLERLVFMINDSKTSVLLTQQSLVSNVNRQTPEQIFLDTQWETILREPKVNPRSLAASSNLAYLIYTSGSTGTPKGVMVEHGSLTNYVRYASRVFDLNSNDRILQFASICFDAAAEEIFPCLCLGATLFLRTNAMISSIPVFLQSCKDRQLTVIDLPTAFWHELTIVVNQSPIEFPGSIRLVIIGGEEAQWKRLLSWKRNVDSQIRLVNTYGPTETTIVATMQDLSQLPTESIANNTVPIGKVVDNLELTIMDKHLEPVPVGETGEICIGGVGLARGYSGLPRLTSEKFTCDPLDSSFGSRIYRTGDLGRQLPDGTVEFHGRLDHQVKIRGYRIELSEIESILLNHPAVRSNIVTTYETETGEKNLAAYLVCDPKNIPGVFELRSFLEQRLPDYMVPLSFTFLKELPLMPNGKIDRCSLPAPGTMISGVKYTAPKSPFEQKLVSIWEEILNLKRVGTNDNFFRVGGHSILATRLIHQISATFDVELSLGTIYDFPTIACLAKEIKQLQEKHGHLQEKRLEELLNEIESMSPEELLAELGHRG